jgi:adenine-specific DNA-methyltransferase
MEAGKKGKAAKKAAVGSYGHPQEDSALRPEIGAQAHFRKPKPPAEYRYDSSLAPELNRDAKIPPVSRGYFACWGGSCEFRVGVGRMP